MRVIKTWNSVYEVDGNHRVRRVSSERVHPFVSHNLSDGLWHDLESIEHDHFYNDGAYVFTLKNGAVVVTSPVVEDVEVE